MGKNITPNDRMSVQIRSATLILYPKGHELPGGFWPKKIKVPAHTSKAWIHLNQAQMWALLVNAPSPEPKPFNKNKGEGQ